MGKRKPTERRWGTKTFDETKRWLEGKTISEVRFMTQEEKDHLKKEMQIDTFRGLVPIVVFGPGTHYIFSGGDGQMFFGNAKTSSISEIVEAMDRGEDDAL